MNMRDCTPEASQIKRATLSPTQLRVYITYQTALSLFMNFEVYDGEMTSTSW